MEDTHACMQTIWIKRFFFDIVLDLGHITIYYDNPSTIFLAKNLTFQARTKHINV